MSTLKDFGTRQLDRIAGESGAPGGSNLTDETPEEAGRVADTIRKPRFSARAFDCRSSDRLFTAFDVSQPVADPGELWGRESEVDALMSGVVFRRNHGIVRGPRGSGKTSLVRVFGMEADERGVVVLYSAGDSATTFGRMVRGYLAQIPEAMIAEGSVDEFRRLPQSFAEDATPHDAVSAFAHVRYAQLVLVLDEFDRITDQRLLGHFGSLLKLLSDARLPIRFVLVGSNAPFDAMLREHPALARNLSSVSTLPLDDAAVADLLDHCTQAAGLGIADDAKTLLVQASCGSPYHARLFGLHAAIKTQKADRKRISSGDARQGIREAFEEWSAFNPEDAATFRQIVLARAKEALSSVAFARLAAAGIGPVVSADADSVDRENDDIKPPATLGTAVIKVGDRLSFRDSLAPVFLVGLNASHERGRKDVRA